MISLAVSGNARTKAFENACGCTLTGQLPKRMNTKPNSSAKVWF
jgi:hypothetical protein